MSRRNPFGVLALAISLGVLSGIAQAGNEGQEDLDKATKANINAKTLSDLAEVIRLCEGALAKGLDEENTSIAKSLLASALCQRGNDVSKTIFDSIPPDPRWAEYRRVALEDLEKAVKLEPELHKAYYNIARLNLLPDGDAKRAAQALDLAIRYAKADPVLQAQAFVLRSEIQKDSQKRLADLSEAVRVAPDDVAVLRARGAAYSQLDKLTEALADFDAALRLDPKHVPTMEAKSLLLAKMKKFDEAFAVLEQVRKLDPKSASPLAYRAQVNAMKPDLAAALKDLNEALRLEPNSVKSLLLRAAVHRELKENDLARADVEKALTLRPNLDTAVQFLASLLAGEGKFREAIAQVEELVKADPDDAEAQLQLALLYTGDQKYDKAVQIYSNLIAKDASNWMALYGRADTLLSLGKHAEAVADYEKAFKVQPNDSRLLNNYSWVLSTSPFDKVRNGKRALELAKEACRLTDYKQAHILSTLAAAYAELGDFQNAIEWSKKAVALGKDDQKEALAKELESYQAGKPVRELKTPETAEKPAAKKPDKAKPAAPEKAKPLAPEKPKVPEKKATDTPKAAPKPPASK